MKTIEAIRSVNYIIALIFFICYTYQIFYLFIPFLKKDRPHQPQRLHRYAILIAARNEAAVISQLLESIRAQDYPADKITAFVVADNCTDNTAELARACGAIVYERHNREQIGKGYALDFLLTQIQRDWGDVFDGYFVFDADNLLRENYVREMNRSFCDGYEIVTSYRNSKNYGDNWISAGYALWFLREAQYLNHARMLLGTSCAVSGTGFLFSRRILHKCGGWKFFLLTEDIEFTIHNIVSGERIGYCAGAEFFDEQPTTFRQSWRQRMRWARGYLQVFYKYAGSLVRGMFSKNFVSCFDMSMSIMPAIILAVTGILVNLTAAFISISTGGNILIALESVGQTLANTYLFMFALGALTTLTEWRRIHTSGFKKIAYLFTFPLFMMTYIPISFTALFKHVEWKPIEHHIGVSIREVAGNRQP